MAFRSLNLFSFAILALLIRSLFVAAAVPPGELSVGFVCEVVTMRTVLTVELQVLDPNYLPDKTLIVLLVALSLPVVIVLRISTVHYRRKHVPNVRRRLASTAHSLRAIATRHHLLDLSWEGCLGDWQQRE